MSAPRLKPVKPSGGFVASPYDLWAAKLARTNPAQKIELIRQGFDAKMLTHASRHYAMPRAQFAKIIGVSNTTAERKIKAGGRLGPFESERLARVATIESEAEQVFGSPALAKDWLLQNNLTFGTAPLNLLDTETGANELRKVLSAIAYGGVA